MDLYFLCLYFFVYGFLGWCTEVGFAAAKQHRFVNRGFLNGPICPIYGVGVSIVIAFLTPYKSNLIILYVASVVLVTLLEGITGWAMDKIFHNKWWDYSNMPLNIGGYVCLLFSVLWGIACVFIMQILHPVIHRLLAIIPQPLGIVLIVVLGIVLFADLYVTASAIFKFNRQLESLERIAAELHEISDQIGEEIYEKTIAAVEKQDELREKAQDYTDDIREFAGDIKEDLKEKADDLKEKALDYKEGFLEKADDLKEGFIEKTDNLREKALDQKEGFFEKSPEFQDIPEELRNRISELRNRYSDELNLKPGKVASRLIKAFPKMKSDNYQERFTAFKKHHTFRK